MRPLLLAILLAAAGAAQAQQKDMTFFITSTGPGKGADLGGLKGADAHCQALAKKAGAGHRQWRAYLSTDKVHARDRIGKGPWKNARGEEIAKSVDDLHKAGRISKQTGLDETGRPVNGRGDSPNRHDILTGSSPDGRALPGDPKTTTCGNWTSGGEGSAMVGHHDRMGLRDDEPSRSWNSSHLSRGCSQDALRSSGGDGLIYCFAAK